MRSKNNPSYLFKSTHNIFYFRVRIPSFIRNQYNTPKIEIRRSLNTRDISVALKRAKYLWVMMESTDYTMKDIKKDLQDENDGRKLLKEFLTVMIESEGDSYLRDYDEETILDSFLDKLSSEGRSVLNKQLEKWDKLPQLKRETVLEQIKVEIESKLIKTLEKHEESPVSDDHGLSNDLVSSKIDEFLDYHLEKMNRSGKPVPELTLKGYKGIYKEFLSIVGNDLKCCDLNKKIIKNYEKTIWKVPSNHTRKPKYKGMDIKEILKMDIPSSEKRSPSTYNNHVMRVKKFLKWGGREDYMTSGLEGFIDLVSDTVKSNAKKDKFTDDELQLLFNCDVYEKEKFKQPSRYWLPLLALFTGSRGEELAQLYTDDIEKDTKTGIDIINIRENKQRKQHLKNNSSPRKIPIHQKLIKLGFIEFVNTRKPNSMLFPELENSTGNNFKKFGNNFNRKTEMGWKWKCGVTRDKTSFHSFRHNVVDYFAKSNISERIACSIVGHEYKGEGLVKNYIKPHELKELQQAVNSLNFPSIVWKKIKKREW